MSGDPRSHLGRGYLLVLGAATAWGTLGLFYTVLGRDDGLAPVTIVFFRAAIGLAALLAIALIRRRSLHVERRHWPLFAALGAVGVAAFYLVYAYAVQVAGVAVAAVLMYTAPVWVTLYAWRFLGERPSRTGILALVGTLAGAALVAQVYEPGLLRLNAPGIALGLGSSLCYGCYSILNKQAVRHYSPWTVLTLGLAFGVPLLALVQTPSALAHAVSTPQTIVWLLAMALGPGLCGGLLYAAGLHHLPASVASIVVSMEPVVAGLLAFLLLGERLAPGQILGALLIIGSITLLGSRDLVGRRRPIDIQIENRYNGIEQDSV